MTELHNYHKVPLNQKIYLGFASAGANTLNGLLYGALLKFYTDIIGLAPVLYGYVFLIFGIWNAINDPLFGYLSDRRKSEVGVGKRLPWMRKIIPLFFMGYFFIWIPEPTWSQTILFLFLLIALFVYDTSFTIFVLNHCALSTGITDSPEERASISMISTYVNMIPGALVGFIPAFVLTSDLSRPIMIIIFFAVGILGASLMIIGVWKIREPKILQEEPEPIPIKSAIIHTFKSKSFIFFVFYSFSMGGVALSFNAFIPFVLEDILNVSEIYALLPGMIAGAILLAMYPVIWKLNNKFGVRTTLMLFICICAMGYLGIFFTANYWVMILFYSCVLCGSGAHWMLLNTIVGDIADEDQLKTGFRREGMFFGINALVSTPAQSVIVFIFTQIITIYGYNGMLDQQTAETIQGIRFGVGILPFCFLILGFIMLYFYPLHGERYQEMKKQISRYYEQNNHNKTETN